MQLVFVRGRDTVLAVDPDGRLDLSPLHLKPSTISIQDTKGLVGRQGRTKRKWSSLQEDLTQPASPAPIGSATNKVQIKGEPVSGG